MGLLAEIADKMRPIGELWEMMLVVAVVCSLITAGAAMASKYFALIPLLIIAFITLVITSPQGSWDERIVKELGESYLCQQRLAGCLPFSCSLFAWLLMMWFMRPGRLPSKYHDPSSELSGEL